MIGKTTHGTARHVSRPRTTDTTRCGTGSKCRSAATSAAEDALTQLLSDASQEYRAFDVYSARAERPPIRRCVDGVERRPCDNRRLPIPPRGKSPSREPRRSRPRGAPRWPPSDRGNPNDSIPQSQHYHSHMTYGPKIGRILFKYYLREAAKRLFGWLPFVLFLASFGLFATVFIPAIGQRLAHRLADQPEQFTLSGRVLFDATDATDTAPVLATDARIEIGGFTTTTDATGSYQLQFWTPQRQSVTVVLRFRGTTTIKTLRLPTIGNRSTRNWVLTNR